jgi:hypothetical protein
MRHAKLTMLLVALAAGATQVALADTVDGEPGGEARQLGSRARRRLGC